MDFEQTDQEQVEALQKWWRENWMSLIGGLVLGLAGILGWQHYTASKQQEAADASQMYEAMKQQLASNNLDAARSGLKELQTEHSGSPYITQGQLAIAETQAKAGDWTGAGQTLSEARQGTSDKALLGLIRLRMARVLWAQGKADEALKELDPATGAYAPLYLELKGDISLAKNDKDAAREAYKQALASDADYLDRPSIQQKLDALN